MVILHGDFLFSYSSFVEHILCIKYYNRYTIPGDKRLQNSLSLYFFYIYIVFKLFVLR